MGTKQVKAADLGKDLGLTKGVIYIYIIAFLLSRFLGGDGKA
jgi:hypothetical protein